MNLSLKIVLTTGTLLGTAFGLSNLADAAPAGMIQAAPAVQTAGQSGIGAAPQVEKVWWHRHWGWHRHYYYHPHYWHRWHRW
jgi:hypothetical protein